MTALAGVWNLSGGPGAAADCARMLKAQRIYGPDGDAIADWGALALGRCLFDVLPEDGYDRGPIEGGGGRYLLVGDVRLDNRDELADALGIAPDAARTLPDAAFLLRAWERWEEGVFAHLFGDYAFALWDAAEHRLVLARDHLGNRPLHYHLGDGFVAFASMPKGLHALPAVPYAPDETRMAEMLALLPEAGPRSFFEGISRVESGHYALVTAAGVTQHRHWNPTPASIGSWRGGDPVAALRAELDRAVRVRLRGAGDAVASHLSAGFDSAAVMATAAREMAGRGGRVVAFTAVPRPGFDGPAPEQRLGDEGPLAARTAAQFANVEHVLVPGEVGPITERWDRSFFLLDRPMMNPCNDRWAAAINAEVSRRRIRVLLTGEMGNMTISYDGLQLLPELVRQRRWLRLWRESRALVRKGGWRWRGVGVAAFGPWLPRRAWIALHRWRGGRTMGVEGHSAMRIDSDRARDLEATGKARGIDFLYRPRKDAFETRLWVLRRADAGNYRKAAMAEGIDHRDPTTDRRLIEFCLSLPAEAFLREGVSRALARAALADRLPAEVLGERRKGYQAADWHESLVAGRGALADDIARLEHVPAAAALLDLPRMRRMIEEMPESGWERAAVIDRYRSALLRGAVAGHFLRRASRSNA